MKNIFTGIAFVLVANLCLAQYIQDTDSIEKNEQQILSKAIEYDYQLLKANLLPLINGGIEFEYEHYVNKEISAIGKFAPNFSKSRNGLILSAGGRRYYNLEKRALRRINEEKTTKCFSANYIEGGLMLRNGYGRMNDTTNRRRTLFGAYVKTGLQRSIGKIMYGDINIGYNRMLGDGGRFLLGAAIGVTL